jgi:TPR repeat protein
LTKFQPALIGIVYAALFFGPPSGASPAEPEEVLIARCEQGMAASCLDMGVKDTDAIGKAVNLSRGLVYFEKGCMLNNARACALAAFGHYNAKGSPTRDLMKAISFGTKSCDGNDAGGCYNLGTVFKNATGMPDHAGRAQALFVKSCTLGSVSGCGAARPSGPTGTERARTATTPASSEPPNCLLAANYTQCWLNNRGSTEGQYARSTASASAATSQNAATGAPAPSNSTGHIVCTSSNYAEQRFTYTNAFPGTANQLAQHQRSVASMQASIQSSASGLGFGANTGNAANTANAASAFTCKWHPTQSEAASFTQRALSQANNERLRPSRMFYSSREY